MRVNIGLTALLLSAAIWVPGMQVAAQHDGDSARLQALGATPQEPASVTVPEAESPVVVANAAAANTRGWYASQVAPAPEDLTDDVLAAYTLAVAVSPTSCHITTPILAAIGQVESGNLAGKTLDENHRVVPAILGPVLDGLHYRAVADTDAGAWDGNKQWDRALGPMQIIPASWRVVGLDLDGDGVRDPQNVYDSAGAAMVYLCSGGRDLSTADGLRQAVLSYNKSPAYLDAVLAWKAVFDKADLTGSVPFVASLAVPMTSTPLESATPAKAAPTTTAADRPVASKVKALAPAGSVAPSATPGQATAPTTRPSPAPSTPAASGAPEPTPAAATPTQSPSPAPDPAAPATDEPAPTPTPTKPDPTPLPECPVPTPDDPTAAPVDGTPTEPVVSPETCTPPEGYVFDPETLELVLIPAETTAP
jgi:hypothetical protein